MRFRKKTIILALLLLSLFMISAVSAASNTTETSVNSDVSNDNTKLTTTTTNDVSDSSVEKTSTGTDDSLKKTEKRSTTNDTDTILKETSTPSKKLKTSTSNEDLLKDTSVTDWSSLKNAISSSLGPKVFILNGPNEYIADEEITINNGAAKITINGNGRTINAQGQNRMFTVKAGELILENLKLINGKANEGGAILVENVHVNVKLTLINTILQNNTATNIGGAILTVSTSKVNITQSTLQNNTARQGGAIYTSNSNITITSSTLQNNQATGEYGYGGAIQVVDNSKINITSSLFMDNNADVNGSAIFGYRFDDLIVNHNIFLNNTGNNIIYLDNSGTVNLDYNWFGNTVNNHTVDPNVGTTINTWLFLNANADPDTIIGLGKSSTIVFKLSLYNKTATDNIPEYDNTQLKPVNLKITRTKGIANPIAQLGKSIQYYSKESGKGSITASISDISYTKEVNIISETSFTALYNNITKSIETGTPLTLDHNYTYDPSTDENLIKGIPITSDIYINGNGHTISGNNTARIFRVTDGGHLTLENITLTKGKGQPDLINDKKWATCGGAIYVYSNSQVTITTSTIQNNQAENHGGAIIALNGSQINITNSILQNNTAMDGGAIHTENSQINITTTTIQNNNAGTSGGAIHTENSQINITTTTIQNNKVSQSGGAIYATSNSQINITTSILQNNTATMAAGAIHTENSNITITQSTLQNNKVSQSGGAIYAYESNITITQSTLQNNQATNGNSGAIRAGYNSHLNITTSTIQNNTAKRDGGAILGTESDLTVNHNIFLNNTGTSVIYLNKAGTVNLDYNWFGNTETNFGDAPTGVNEENLNNWLFLNAADPDTIIGLGGSSNIVFKLSLYNKSTNNVTDYDNTQLKSVNLTITKTKGETNENNASIGETIIYTPNEYGIGSITASIANIEYTKEIKIARDDSFTALYENITKSTEEITTITLKHNYTYDNTTDQDLQKGIIINKTVHIIGNGYTISGNNTARIFKVTNGGHLTLENITLTKGQGQNETIGSRIRNVGGAIYTYNAKLTLINTTLQNNNATNGEGGAIYTYNSQINITTTTLQNNQADIGGAIHAESASEVNINNSTLQNNTVKYGGGAIYARINSQVNINNSTLQNNNATYSETGSVGIGGAIHAESASEVNINKTILQNNQADIGGVISTSNSNITINNSTLQNNTSNTNGGAIYIYDNSNIIITQSILQNNQATNGEGGAIYASMSDLVVNDSIFLNNTGNNVIVLYSCFNVDFDCNWFGNNATDYKTLKIPVEGVTLNNWLFLNATAVPDLITVLSSSDVSFELFLYNSSSGNKSVYDNSQLKPVNLTITYTNGDVDKDIAKLNETIEYTPKNSGTGSVTARISNAEYTITLEVTKIPTNITVNTYPITLNVTDTSKITAKLDPSDAGSLTYTSSNETVVTVDSNGNITAVGQGIANITVSFAGQGNYAAAENKTIQVTVNLKEIKTTIDEIEIPTLIFEGKETIIKGSLIANGTGFANQTITLNITNTEGYQDTYTGITDDNGRFTIPIRPGVNGPVNITICYPGNSTTQYLYPAVTNTSEQFINLTKTSFKYLNNQINDAIKNNKNNITLNWDYTYDPDTDSELTNGITITNTFTIYGDNHTIDGNNTARIFNVTGNGDLTLEDLKLVNGCGQNVTLPDGEVDNVAGAIYLDNNTKVTIINCTLENNTSAGEYSYGGAIYADKNSQVNINNTTLTNNNASYAGGAIFTENSQININNTTITNNQAIYGGAILAYKSNISINNTTLQNNQADGGGAILSDESNININNSILTNNNANHDGGAINTYNNSQINITNSIISNNTASEKGGAIYTENDLTIQNSLFQDNIASCGSGIYIVNSTFTSKNNTFINSDVDGENYKVKPIDPQIKIENIADITEGNPVTITVNADNQFNTDLILNVNGNNYTVKMLNGKGQITISDLKPGTYTAKIRFAGNENYTNTTVTSNTFKVNNKPTPSPSPTGKQNTKIIAKNKVYKPSKYRTYTVTVKNKKGKPVKNTKVKLKIGKKTYTRKTNKQGIATFKIKNTKKSKKSKKTKKYSKITATLNKKNKKDKLTLTRGSKINKATANNKGVATFKIKNSKTKTRKYTITLKTTTNQIIKKQKVTLKVKGKTFKAKTNNKGKATFKITNLNKKGKYKTTIQYKGNNQYNKSSKTVKITIKE